MKKVIMIEDSDYPAGYTEEDFRLLSDKWNEVYSTFLKGIDDLSESTGGGLQIDFKVKENEIGSIHPHFRVKK